MATQTPGRTIHLKDGRSLGYAEFGNRQGRPLFFFHGCPESRLEAKIAHDAAKAAGVRIISLDRPGMGLSDFMRGRTLLDWPQDVAEAADAFDLQKFAVIGHSGGGPYAAVCAFKIPERLTAAGIICGVGPFDAPDATRGMSRQDRVLFFLVRHLPWLARPLNWYTGRERLQIRLWRFLPDCDRAIVERSELREVFVQDLREALRQGSRGMAHEFLILCRPWGFRLQDITMPVYLWQGDADTNVPVSMAHYQARAIPNCHATFYAGEGHLFLVDRMPEILSALLPAG